MPEHDGDKTQDATPHRRQEARKQGQVAKSQDLGSAVLLLVGLLVLMMTGGGLIEYLGRYSADQLGGNAWLSADLDSFVRHFNDTLRELGKHLLPIFGLLLLGAIAVNLAQVGFLFLPDKLAPDITRLDPLKGLQRIFSLTSAMRLGFGLFKILVIGVVAAVSLYSQRERILGLTASGRARDRRCTCSTSSCGRR